MSFSEYPKAMTHPNYRPAVLSQDTFDGTGKTVKAAPGSPAKFPPVYVNNHDQELEYASKGYVPNGTSDPEAYRRASAGADLPNTHQHVEFPKYLYQMNDGEIEAALVRNKQEQDALQGKWYATPGDAEKSEETLHLPNMNKGGTQHQKRA